jgi:hypothetical protein
LNITVPIWRYGRARSALASILDKPDRLPVHANTAQSRAHWFV